MLQRWGAVRAGSKQAQVWMAGLQQRGHSMVQNSARNAAAWVQSGYAAEGLHAKQQQYVSYAFRLLDWQSTFGCTA